MDTALQMEKVSILLIPYCNWDRNGICSKSSGMPGMIALADLGKPGSVSSSVWLRRRLLRRRAARTMWRAVIGGCGGATNDYMWILLVKAVVYLLVQSNPWTFCDFPFSVLYLCLSFAGARSGCLCIFRCLDIRFVSCRALSSACSSGVRLASFARWASRSR